jgi:hypothetical protein
MDCLLPAIVIALLLVIPASILSAAVGVWYWRRFQDRATGKLLFLAGTCFAYFYNVLTVFFFISTEFRLGEFWWLDHILLFWVLLELIVLGALLLSLANPNLPKKTMFLGSLSCLVVIALSARSLSRFALIQYDRRDKGLQIEVDKDLCLSVMNNCSYEGSAQSGEIRCPLGQTISYMVQEKPNNINFEYHDSIGRREHSSFSGENTVQTYIELSRSNQVLRLSFQKGSAKKFGEQIVRKCIDHLVIVR